MSTYIVTDIEADGPVPGLYSMISLAAAAVDEKGEVLSTFFENLLPLPTAAQHPDTMRWWATIMCRLFLQDP